VRFWRTVARSIQCEHSSEVRNASRCCSERPVWLHHLAVVLRGVALGQLLYGRPPWSVKFVEQPLIDFCGPSSELLTDAASSIFDASSQLVILAPNNRRGASANRDFFIPFNQTVRAPTAIGQSGFRRDCRRISHLRRWSGSTLRERRSADGRCLKLVTLSLSRRPRSARAASTRQRAEIHSWGTRLCQAFANVAWVSS
jgi:hypothetical protein